MQHDVYEMIHKAEAGWWYRGRNAAIKALLHRAQVSQNGDALDYGAGYGAMFKTLSGYKHIDAFEIFPECIASCKQKGYRTVFTSESELSTSSALYECIGAFDVIEHVDDDVRFLEEISKKLHMNGVLVATVPAHQFLFGPYDTAAHHFRRYGKKELRTKLEHAGFQILALSYWNATLFPVAAILRTIGAKAGGEMHSPYIIDRILGWVVMLEAFILRFLPLPMGLSLIVVAKRPS